MATVAHAFPLDCEAAYAALVLLRDRLKAALQKQRDDDYVRRTSASQNPRARRGANWELYWLLNTPLAGPTVSLDPHNTGGPTNDPAGTGAPWWMK